MPLGVPTIKHWVEATHNHEVLKKNHDMLLENLNINDPVVEKSSIFKFKDEIMLHATIQKSDILLNPCSEMITAKENLHSYLKLEPTQSLFLLHVRMKSYNDLSNWNIPKLKKEIFSLIDAFTNTETTAMYLSIHNTLSKSNKRRHIKFYKEVKDELQKQLSTEKIDIDDLEYQG